MSDWKTCINNGRCFSYVLYNPDGSVNGECEAHVNIPSSDYDSVTMGTRVMTLNCGGKRISIVGRSPSEFQIGAKVFVLGADGGTAILDINIDTAYEISATPNASTERVLARVELKEGGKEIVKDFNSRAAYDLWKNGLGEGQVKGEKLYFLNASGTDVRFHLGFESEGELKKLLSAPEAFIVGPNSGNPKYIYSSKEFAEYLKGKPRTETVEAVFLRNTGGAPALVKGNAGDIGVFAEQLAYDVSIKVSEVEGAVIPPDGDFGVKFTGGYGLRSDENYLKDSLDDITWVDESVKNDFAAAQTDKRAKYWQIGLELEGHYILNFDKARWFQLVFGASDDIDYTKGPKEAANSWLVSNTIATDIGLRLGYPGIFFLGLYPVNLGWYYAGGQTTLKDTSVKQETDINAFVWQPEAELGFFLCKKQKCALSLEYYYRHFIESSIPLQGVHTGGLSFKFLFGGSQEMDRKVEAERHDRPKPAGVEREIETTLNVEPERPLEYMAVLFQKAIDVKFDNANAFFTKNSSELTGEGMATASGLAQKIKTYFGELRDMGIEVDPGSQNLMIKAFADSQGKAEYPDGKRGNAQLSADRAQSFRTALANELKEDNITVNSEGMGEQLPALYKCDGACDITDIRPDALYRYQDTDKEKALFTNEKNTDIDIDRLYKVKTSKGKDSLTGSNYADALYGQVSLDLEGDKKKERYLEDLSASRRLTAKLTYNLDAIDTIEPKTFAGEIKIVDIGGAKFTNILVPLGSTEFIPEKLNVKENSVFVEEFIRPFIYLVKEANDEADVSEIVVSISLSSKNSARDTEYIGKYLGFVAGRFTDKPVRVFVSVNDRFGDSVIFAKGSQTANIDPASNDENSLKLRNKWLEMLSGE